MILKRPSITFPFLFILTLAAGSLLLSGCDLLRSDKTPPGDEFIVLIESLPQNGAELECVMSYEQEGQMQADQFQESTPIEAGPWFGDAFSMMCASTKRESSGEVAIRLLRNTEVVEERAFSLPLQYAQVSWPEAEGANAAWGLGETQTPTIFDMRTTSGDGTLLTNQRVYELPSKSLADTLRVGSYDAVGEYSGAFFRSGSVGERLYTPRFWTDGTSFVHYDKNTNGLMVPFLPKGRAFLSPLLTAEALMEMGWGKTDPAVAARSARQDSPSDGVSPGDVVPGPTPLETCHIESHAAHEIGPRKAQAWEAASRAASPAQSHQAHAQGLQTSSNNFFAYEFEGDWPEKARQAMKRAGAIWSEYLSLSDSIHVTASWEELETGALASAAPAFYHKNFDGAQEKEVFYPAAMANHLAGQDLDPEAPEIDVVVNSRPNWYYEADYSVPDDQSSFVTLLLHELGHGLGFLGTMEMQQPE